MNAEELELLVHGGHGHPHAILGPHTNDGTVTVRVFRPLAKTVRVTYDGPKGKKSSVDLDHEYSGIWVGELPVADVPDYRVEVDYGQGATTRDDPYRFLPTLGEMDLHLINEGRHELLWTVLGAHRAPLRGARHRAGRRHVLRGVGAGGQGRAHQGRLQQLGRPRAPDAPARHLGRLGAVRARTSARGRSTSS